MATLRPEIAVIGAGLMGRWHAANARRLGARVVAIVDPDQARALRLARDHGARALPDLRQLQEKLGATIAHVCTPLASHYDTCRTLLESGWHVLCEKPLTPTTAQARELLDLAEGAGRHLCPVHQFAVQRGVEALLRRRSSLGPFRQVAFTFCTAGANADVAGDRDTLLLDVLPHPLSILRRLFPASALAGVEWSVTHPEQGEMLLTGIVDGVPVSILVSCSARPTEASAVMRGDGGTALLDFFHGYASFQGAAVSRARKLTQPFLRPFGQLVSAGANLALRVVTWEPAYPGLREFLRRYYGAVDGRNPPPVTPQDVLEVCQVRDRVAMALGGQP